MQKAIRIVAQCYDILGDYLIEVNVTSPTCLQEMDRLYNVKLEEKIIDFVEKLVK